MGVGASFLSALLFFPMVNGEHSCPLSADSAVEVSDVKSAWMPVVLLCFSQWLHS